MTSHEAYLRSSLLKYKYPDQAKKEILTALQTFSDLRPALNPFVFNDGTSRELLCLDGTIPVPYKGKTYNIPVCLWLMDTHPYNPPMIYVRPTSNMQIKPGRHVDQNGRIYLPYLHEWKHPQSDLVGLVQVLVCVFGEEPPVFAKSQQSAPTGGAAAQPPYPVASPGSQPPYPTSASSMPVPSYPPTGPAGYRPPSNYPPQSGYTPYPPYPGQPQPSAAPQAGPTSFQPYPQGIAPYPQVSQSYPQQAAAAQPASLAPGSTSTISEEHIRASLLSAVEDKMRRRLREIFAQAQAEMDTLKKTQEDLQRGRQKLDNMLNQLEREQSGVEDNIRRLQQKDEEVREVLTKMENRDEVSIDEAIQPSTPLYKQLLQSFAEEQATEDAIYYMGEALRKGVIDLDVFLKQVRELSRKQFMCRMLIRKCRQTAGLPEV